MTTSALFSPLRVRDIHFRNRIAVSPMCQYSAENGMANDWHFVHLGGRAAGGAALVFVEATAVEARGRISLSDLGLWNDEQADPLARIGRFIKKQGVVPGIQLAHAGRKASVDVPWRGSRALAKEEGGWCPVAPSALAFSDQHPIPIELTAAEIRRIVAAFASSTQRAVDAGFEVLEIHSAHGYLIHEFLSPLSNMRSDEYGGSWKNRTRFLREVLEAVRAIWPERFPLFLRTSATDWIDGGWTIKDSVDLASATRHCGVDLIDCSSGGISPNVKLPVTPGYQVAFAEQIRRQAGILTGAVGLITDALQAESIIREGQADLVLMAREFLRNPYWPVQAARILHAEMTVPTQYQRAYL